MSGRWAIVSFYVPPLPDLPNVRVVVRWRDGRASAGEVMALRRLLPAVRDRPVAEVFREAREGGGWVLATCRPADAPRVCQAAERQGLVVAVEPVPAPDLVSVSDDEVVAELAFGGRAVTDFFLVGGLVCSVNGRCELMARRIDDPALAAATAAYLRRVGVRE